MKISRYLGFLVGLIGLTAPAVEAHSQSRGPLKSVYLVEDTIISTPSQRVHAASNFHIIFRLSGRSRRIKVTLEPNPDIIPHGASIQYLDSDGKIAKSEPIVRADHKIFKGESWTESYDGSWTHVGWARITVRKDGANPSFEGVFTLARDHHHIQLGSFYKKTRHEFDPDLDIPSDDSMVVFKDSDIRQPYEQDELKKRGLEQTCSADKLDFNTNPQHPVFSPPEKRGVASWGAVSLGNLFGKRQIDGGGFPNGGNSGGVNLKGSIGKTAGCPTTRKVALIGVATDCEYTGSFDSTEDMRKNVINQINSASERYEKTFNITLGLRNLTVSQANCPGTPQAATPWNIKCGGNATISSRLSLFSSWRSQHGDSNAYWTLLTNCPTNTEVGLAWLGQLCVNGLQKNSDQSTSGANVVAKTSTEWQVIAHESGHTFGAVHDCDSQTCADGKTVNAQQCCPLSANTCDAGGKYIMNPSASPDANEFSPCTIGNICSALGRNSVNSDCLVDNKGITDIISGQQCGNGIVEDGEDCDCGGESSCGSNQCCDPKTCKFKSGAVCDDSNEDCCQQCQYAPSGFVCRQGTGVCDPQETCSGKNATCPPDKTAPDGQDCGDNLQCASGQCTSRDQQCKTLMGSLTSNNDTYACDSIDCTLSCASPEFGPNECYSMQQNFLDGTPCGGGGRCSNGQCEGSSVGKEISSWIHDNKKLVIGIACGVGGILLLLIVSCIVSRVRNRKRPKPTADNRHWVQNTSQYNGYQAQTYNFGGYNGYQSVRYA